MASDPQANSSSSAQKKRAAAAIAAAVVVATPFAAGFEGLRTHPYLDPAGIKTVCFGETEVGMRVYSPDECGAMLRKRLANDYAPKVLACLPQLTDEKRKPVFAALIDAAYNAGPKAVCNSRMAVSIRAGQWKQACDGFSGWYVTARDRRTGERKTLPGLVRRREAERKLCLQGAA